MNNSAFNETSKYSSIRSLGFVTRPGAIHNTYNFEEANQIVQAADSHQLLNDEARNELAKIGIAAEEISRFEGQVYLDIYPDLIQKGIDLDEALQHYALFGFKENRRFPQAC